VAWSHSAETQIAPSRLRRDRGVKDTYGRCNGGRGSRWQVLPSLRYAAIWLDLPDVSVRTKMGKAALIYALRTPASPLYQDDEHRTVIRDEQREQTGRGFATAWNVTMYPPDSNFSEREVTTVTADSCDPADALVLTVRCVLPNRSTRYNTSDRLATPFVARSFHMPVITLLSPKGGVGKTTTALLLATELSAQGADVILIDADPNFPLSKWAALPGKPTNIEVIEEVDEETIIDTIGDARKRARYVIVDLEGRASGRVTNALLVSNLALIPMQGSALDSNEAARAFKNVRQVSKHRDKPLKFAAVLAKTQASSRLWPRELKQIIAGMAEAGIPMIGTALADRGAFRALFSFGGTLATMSGKDVGSLETARANAAAFTLDVLNILNEKLPA
jgi:chromosome partitioning protein